MSTAVQRRRGTTAQHASFAGLEGELTVDTTKDTLVIHDGSTAGGRPLLREDQSNLPTSAPTTGIYNASGSLAISTGGSGKLFINSTGVIECYSTAASGTGLTTALKINSAKAAGGDGSEITWNLDFPGYSSFAGIGGVFTGGGNNGHLVFKTVGSGTYAERMRLDSAGRLGVGTISPAARLHISDLTATDVELMRLQVNLTSPSGNKSITWADSTNAVGRISLDYTSPTAKMRFGSLYNGGYQTSDLMTLTPTGLGIGNNGPQQALHVTQSGGNNFAGIRSQNSNTGTGTAGIEFSSDATYAKAAIGLVRGNFNGVGSLVFYNASSTGAANWSASDERARIDSSGRLLVGTSTPRSGFQISTGFGNVTPVHQFEFNSQTYNGLSITHNAGANTYPAVLAFGKSRGSSAGSYTAVASGDGLGWLDFYGADGTNMVRAATISAEVDGTPGANDMPGRLVFSTTADGASSPTPRMTISSDGNVYIGRASTDDTVQGTSYNANRWNITTSSAISLLINRQNDDGNLVQFRQANTDEGSISVSGTTVSYNGAHLSRWSQLSSGAERTEILRGSVLSNIDEMCEWGNEDNEQLNRMKVSDVEGDKNVSGVFQAWDDDDDTYTNDFYCAMTGDFIIRIAEGVTVERGDLLMSAGDGTAKPQDDDIIRSKTIAKVTSTNVSCTYDDGSYCVPCVLMAC